ncbi:MAG: hypothetical protein L0Z55_10625 [Planctomycetes bacterium]|nr:hypothetical protein [Planctomycetota bacterium]
MNNSLPRAGRAALLLCTLAGGLGCCPASLLGPEPPAPNAQASGSAGSAANGSGAAAAAIPRALHPDEWRLRNLRQLTFGGENAEAYFSADSTRLIFQSTRPPHECDQIYTMNADGSDPRLVSTGEGRTTCAYFFYPEDDRILYSSTHEAGGDCPHRPDHSRGYVWPVFASYEIYAANADGSGLVRLTDNDAYDAEATFRPDGGRIVFTSDRDGDLEIYSMAPDGGDVKRLTHTPGYDGGAFYSPGGGEIVFRGHHPEGEELAKYKSLLADHLVQPSRMEIFIMDADGSNLRQVTKNGAANFAPYFHPSGKRIIFSSNMDSTEPRRREFDLYMIGTDGAGLERITFAKEFDAFPMFSHDGRTLVFCSNRWQDKPGETNVFIAEWVE